MKGKELPSLLGAFIGNILQHYESSLFGWIAPFLAPLIFPHKTHIEALFLTFMFIPLSYITKPLGALLWGLLGDLWGRKPIITITLSGMAISTFSIGCLPLSHKTWIFLSICRLCQGFFSSGEETGAGIYLLERTKPKNRTYLSSIYEASTTIGIVLSSFLASKVGSDYWRLLFWIGAIGGLIGVLFRAYGKESPNFKRAKPSLSTLWQYRKIIVSIMFVSGLSYANYFFITVFFNGFLPEITSLTTKQLLSFNTQILWIDFFLLLGCGVVCKWISKKKIMLCGAMGITILAIPLFASLPQASSAHIAITRLVFVVFGVAIAAPYYAWMFELLPDKHRLIIGGLGTTLGAKLFGSPIPALATYLVGQTKVVWVAAVPLTILSLATLTTLIASKKANSIKPLY
jgi:MFS transporter, MHS family, proline/betaine transporter